MTTEQIESLKRMVNSKNLNDIVLACQIIYQNKPFDNWRSLTKLAKMNYSRSMAKQTKKWGFYWGVEQLPDNTFLKKILEIPMSKTLYKKDSNGNVRYLKIWTEKDELVQESGVVGTDNPIEHRKTCKGKNIGKSNETTPEKQAKLEMQSKIAEKLKEDYFEKLESAKSEQVILPMLAKNYKDHKDKIDWNNCFVQPKLDGMRCLAVIKDGDVKLISRQGTEITTVPHIVEDIKNQNLTDRILDGELYCHGIGFQNNMKLIKKNRPGETEKIEYWIYDTVDNDNFSGRFALIKSIVKGSKYLREVTTHKLINEEKLKEYHTKAVGLGFEGSIVRWGNASYKINGRSENLLKYKDFQDIALKIHDVIPADQRPNWGQFIFYWKGAKGHPYGDDYIGCGMKFSHEEREELLKNKKNYIGKTAELRYFEKSETGVLRFPVCVGLRLDK